jgi:hypothetical protein
MAAAEMTTLGARAPNGKLNSGMSSGSYTSTNATAVVTESEIDIRDFLYIVMTFKATTFDVTVGVWVANQADFSDEVLIVTPVSVAVGTNRVWSGGSGFLATNGTPVTHAYIRLKAVDTVPDSHGVLAWTIGGKNP